jgi:beta-lactamase regulating signal transducer with metallopeptidase domain
MMLPLTALSAWLCDFAPLVTLLLAAALVARWLIRAPAERMAVAWSTWLGIAALAIVTAAPNWPRVSLLAQRSVLERSEAHLLVGPDVELIDDLPQLPQKDSIQGANARPLKAPFAALTHPTALWQSVIVVAWLMTSGLAVAWIALGMFQTWRLVARSTTAPQWIVQELLRVVGKQKPPGLRISDRLASAAALGALRPRILLPAASADESLAPAVQAALAHEWAHIQRGDLWLLALERLLLPFVAWHPLFWLVRRGVRLDQELLADAAAAGERPIEYAEALVAWAKTARPAPAGLALLSLWESPHTLSRRITMLLDPQRSASPAPGRGWQGLVVAGMLAFVGGLSLLSFRPLTADEPAPEAAQAPTTQSALAEPSSAGVIVLKCTIIEVPTDVLPTILPEVDSQPQPSPALAVVTRSPELWHEALGRFQNDSRTNVISRPQVLTNHGQEARVVMQAAVPWALGEPTRVGLALQVTPWLQPREADEQRIQIRVNGEQSDVDNVADALQPRVKTVRSFGTTATLPLGQTLIVVDRSPLPATDRLRETPLTRPRAVLLVALEPQLVPNVKDPNTQSAPAAEPIAQPLPQAKPQPGPQPNPLSRSKASSLEPSPDFSKLFQGPLDDETKLKAYLLRQVETLKQLHETDANRMQAAKRELDARFAQIQSLVQRLEQNSRDRTNDSEETRVLTKQLADLQKQIDLLVGQTGPATTIPPPPSPANPQLPRAANEPYEVPRAQRPTHIAPYPQPGTPPRADPTANTDRETQAKLLSIDLADAKLAVDEAEEDLAAARSARQSQAYNRNKDGELTPTDDAPVRQAARRVERAKNYLRRIQVQLEGLQQPTSSRNNANSPRPPAGAFPSTQPSPR